MLINHRDTTQSHLISAVLQVHTPTIQGSGSRLQWVLLGPRNICRQSEHRTSGQLGQTNVLEVRPWSHSWKPGRIRSSVIPRSACGRAEVAQECGEDGWPLMVEDAARSGGTLRGGRVGGCTSHLHSSREYIMKGHPRSRRKCPWHLRHLATDFFHIHDPYW